jgi:mono/diheme cytochrome c family protein
MSANPSKNLKLRKFTFAALLGLILVLLVNWATQQHKPWVVPEEFKKLQNPLQPSDSNLRSASELYREKCAQCHGDRGKGDGPQAWMQKPSPNDLTDALHMNALTDGDIFYQITEGRRPMPSFKNRLTPDQRWQLVLLLRSFAQPASPPADKH